MTKTDPEWWCSVHLPDNKLVVAAERAKDVIIETRRRFNTDEARVKGVVYMKVRDARKQGVVV